MLEVAQWIGANTNFDRIYFYGNECPLHVSVGPESSKQVTLMLQSKSSNQKIPRTMTVERFITLQAEDFL
jgi:hypothetical protein